MKSKLHIIFFILLLFSCTIKKPANAEINDVTIENGEFSNGLTGTVWIGHRTIQTEKFSGTTDIILTFTNDHSLEILEWEIIKPGHNYIYDYKTLNGGNIIYIYRDEIEYDDPSDQNSWRMVFREYPAIIERDTISLTNWFSEESVSLEKRTDLSCREDKIIINSTYYENSIYHVRIEYKLLSDNVNGLDLFITSGGDTASLGIFKSMANLGYRRTVLSFSENKVREYEEEILKGLIFDWTKTGSFTEKDKEEYLQKYGTPELSYVWAMLFQNHSGKVFAKSNILKFK